MLSSISLGIGRDGGSRSAPMRANMAASTVSVLVLQPIASAKHSACRGLTFASDSPDAASCFSRTLYKGRNAVERMFCHLKDYRRIATRYDKLATNFLGAIYLVAAITWWL
jgi:transposase